MNIFRDDQKDFKNLIDGNNRVSRKTYIIEAHTVNSEEKRLSRVLNEFAKKMFENKKWFSRFCNDDMDKAYYGNQKFHEDRYKNIIHIVMRSNEQKRCCKSSRT